MDDAVKPSQTPWYRGLQNSQTIPPPIYVFILGFCRGSSVHFQDASLKMLQSDNINYADEDSSYFLQALIPF